jgi:CelD/BcsL family acetyltransferase involved in cellulose biosynthesis
MNPVLTSPVPAAPTVPPGAGLACSVLTDPAAVEHLRAEWLDLLGRSAANEAMLTPTWLLTWWEVYGAGTGRQMRVGAFRENGRLVGLAPLTARRFRHRPYIPFRRLEPLGADVDEGDGVCSDYLNVIAERGAEARVARAFARALIAGEFGRWHEVVLPAMDGAGLMPGLLAEALAAAGLQVAIAETGSAPYIPLPATWDAYLKALPKKKRHSLTSALRAFDAWAEGRSELRRASTLAEMEEGSRILRELHGLRWRQAGEGGVFAAARFNAFHAAVMPRLLQEGALELAWLVVRGEPVAAAYNLVWDGKVAYYQCGRRPDLPDAVRPGIVLLAHLIRGAIEAGRREFDFLGGVALYKSQLALAARPLVQVRAVRPCLREYLRRAADRGLGWARALRNKARSAAGWIRGTARGERSAPPPEKLPGVNHG